MMAENDIKKDIIKDIVSMLNKTDDISLIRTIYKILCKEAKQEEKCVETGIEKTTLN